MSEWQLIETAPEDYDPVLIFDPHPGVLVMAAVRMCECDDDGNLVVLDGWVCFDELGIGECSPTHWMPFPAAPLHD